MAAPGLGIGDLVNACAFIYDMCMKYKDAPKEFDEIAEKAKSTAVVLERIDSEAEMSGNLVDRAGPQAYTQLKDNLKGLRSDSEKLAALVKKYAKIHDEGPGRRLLFTLKESSGLTDLRRRIGLHEQMLQIWYMTLVYGSLRRLEGGQEDILKAIEAIKNWSPRKTREVRISLRNGNIKPLEQELYKSGLEPEAVDVALGTAVDYVDAPPLEQVRMESRARSSLSTMTSPEGKSFLPTMSTLHPRFSSDDDYGRSSGYPPPPPPPPHLDLHPRNSTSARRPHYTYDLDGLPRRRGGDDLHESLEKTKLSEERLASAERERKKVEHLRRKDKRYPSHSEDVYLRKDKRYPSHSEDVVIMPADSRRPRRSSEATKPPPRSPFLVVPDTGPRYRPASYHGPSDRDERSWPGEDSHNSDEQVIIIQDSPRRHRSSSRHSDRSNKDRRDSSTHSYVRTRSSSGGQEKEGKIGRRIVDKMDRIDSIPL